jgi:hypothetical protein
VVAVLLRSRGRLRLRRVGVAAAQLVVLGDIDGGDAALVVALDNEAVLLGQLLHFPRNCRLRHAVTLRDRRDAQHHGPRRGVNIGSGGR